MQARHKYNNVYFGKYDNIKIVKGQGWESFLSQYFDKFYKLKL